MCGGKPDVDNSIQEQMLADSKRAREEEEARAARIRTGTAKIDNDFGKFDDNFYTGFRDNYTGFYQPELDRKFTDARDDLTFALARAGTLNSSMAGQKSADLSTAYDVNRASILSDADGAAADLRANVNNEKSGLVSLLNATGDADRASNEALARSSQLLQTQPRFNPLGDIFAGVTSGIGNYFAGRQDRAATDTYFNGRSASAGSGRTVGG